MVQFEIFNATTDHYGDDRKDGVLGADV